MDKKKQLMKLVTDQWQTTNAIHEQGRVINIWKNRRSYEYWLNKFEVQGLIQKKEIQKETKVEVYWKLI